MAPRKQPASLYRCCIMQWAHILETLCNQQSGMMSQDLITACRHLERRLPSALRAVIGKIFTLVIQNCSKWLIFYKSCKTIRKIKLEESKFSFCTFVLQAKQSWSVTNGFSFQWVPAKYYCYWNSELDGWSSVDQWCTLAFWRCPTEDMSTIYLFTMVVVVIEPRKCTISYTVPLI